MLIITRTALIRAYASTKAADSRKILQRNLFVSSEAHVPPFHENPRNFVKIVCVVIA